MRTSSPRRRRRTCGQHHLQSCTHLENQRLHGLRVLVTVRERLDLLSGLVEELLEVLLALAENLESRLVESSRLGAYGQLLHCMDSLHLPSNLGLLALLLVLGVDGERLLTDDLGLYSQFAIGRGMSTEDRSKLTFSIANSSSALI